MTWVSNDILTVLWFLLPGFIASWVFSGLTAYPKSSEFERIVQALIFTAFAQVVTFLIQAPLFWLGAHVRAFGPWNDDVARVWSVLVATILGLLFAWMANRDAPHKWLRSCRVTKQTGYPSEWFGAFSDRGGAYVVLHLTGERRLYGWPEEWPTDSGSGHFSLAEAEWLVDEHTTVPLLSVSRVLVPAAEVSLVEFMQPQEAAVGLDEGGFQ